jgi:hypothetical protein
MMPMMVTFSGKAGRSMNMFSNGSGNHDRPL